MEQSYTPNQSTDVRSVLLNELKTLQSNTKESSQEWFDLQSKIDNIIAIRYLEYQNR